MNGSGSPAWSGHVPGSGGYRRLLLGLFLLTVLAGEMGLGKANLAEIKIEEIKVG